MSFSVPGSSWTPKSAGDHAQSVLDAINSALAPVGITITPSLGNIVWLFCLGIGSVAALFDESLESAKNSFDPALCDDDQILHMLSVTGLTRIQGSYSTLNVLFTAGSGGPLTVPAGTHVSIRNQSPLFVVNALTVVPAGTQVSIATTCDTIGPVQVAPSQVSGVVEALVNFASVTNTEYTVNGRDIETLDALRVRIINGYVIHNNIEGFILALRALPGISQAKVFFNPSTTTPLVLPGSISLPARNVYIVVNGSSDQIANTWADRSLAPTYGTETQVYTTLSGQLVNVYYNSAVSEDIWVKVYVSSVYTKQAGYDIVIKQKIVALQTDAEIGKTVTSEFVLEVLKNFVYATINGVEVSLTDSAYSRTAVISAKSVPVFSDAKITIVEEP